MPEPVTPVESDWRRYLTAIVRHKWFVLVVVVLGTAAGVLGSRFLSPGYQARASLFIEAAARPHPESDVISGEDIVAAAPGWVDLVTSNAVLDSVIRRLRLYVTPLTRADSAALVDFRVTDNVQPGRYHVNVDREGKTFQLLADDKTVVQRGNVGDSIGSSVGFQWVPAAGALAPGRDVSFMVDAPVDVQIRLMKQLKTRMDLGSSFLIIELKGHNPALTAGTVNAIAQRMVQVAVELKKQKFEQLAQILGGQYESTRQSLDSAESALRDFRVKTAGMAGVASLTSGARGGVGEASPYAGQGIELRGSLEQTRRDRQALDEVVRQIPANGLRVEALSGIPSVRESPRLVQAVAEIVKKQADLRDLRSRYTDESAPVVALQADLDSLQRGAVPALISSLSMELASRETMISPRVNAAFGELRRMPTLSLDQGRLERDVASNAELSNVVRQRYEAARLALVSSLPDVRVLDWALVPRRPSVSLGPLLIVLAFITSFGAAVVGILIRDGLDPKVRYPEQVTRQMRLPILAAVPRADWRPAGLPQDATEPVVEALRGLRLRVLHSHPGDGALVLTITSPGMGEGKSFVSANLALSFADAGYKTLLIDGDLRRGCQHIVLEAGERPGLTDVLAHKATLEQSIGPTSYTGLDLLGSGTRMHRAPELLLSRELVGIMDKLRDRYEIIIVDTPPLAAGADPIILATLTKNLMLVLRSGTSDLALANQRLDVLDTLPIRTIGAVLNDVRDGGAFRYQMYDPKGYEISGGDADRPRILHGERET